MAAELPLLPVSSLLALSYNIPCFDGIVAPCMDARRGQVYNALFERGPQMRRLCEDRALSADELTAELAARGAPVILLATARSCAIIHAGIFSLRHRPACQLHLQPAMAGAAAEQAYAAGGDRPCQTQRDHAGLPAPAAG